MEIDFDKLDEFEDELRYLPEWIPPILEVYMTGVYHRYDFLKAQGIVDKVQEKNLEYRRNLKKSDNPGEFEMLTLWDWVNEHPKFRDLVVL